LLGIVVQTTVCS